MSHKSKKSDYAKDYFVINRKFLQFAGLWPPENPSRTVYYGYKFYQVVVYIITVVICAPCVVMGSFEHLDDRVIMIKTFNLAGSVVMAAIKEVVWIFRGKDMRHIMKTLESDEFHYEDSHDFNPGLHTKQARTTGIRYGLGFFVLGHLTLEVLYGPGYVLGFWYLYNDKPIANVTFFRTLPYYTYVPFEYNTAAEYLMALTFQSVPFYIYGFSLIGLDTLFMNIMNFLGIHLDNLQGAFRTIRSRCLQKLEGPALTEDGLYNSYEMEERMMIEMKKSIRHLQTIISICKKLENIFTFIVLGQVLCTLYILCSSLLLVSTTPIISAQFANEFFYLLTMYFQLVLYCWFGNKIRLKAAAMPQAIWEGDWTGTRIAFQRCMVITMLRMARPLYLTVGKFSPLTLETFISILKGSYSYYTVLKHANEKYADE